MRNALQIRREIAAPNDAQPLQVIGRHFQQFGQLRKRLRVMVNRLPGQAFRPALQEQVQLVPLNFVGGQNRHHIVNIGPAGNITGQCILAIKKTAPAARPR